MSALEQMKSRRSVRKFKNDPIPAQVLDQIIEAGLWAASGKNSQSPIIVAVTDRAVRDRLSETNRQVAGMPEGTDPFYGAPVVLVVLAAKSGPTYVYDGSLTMGNLMLAAHELGVGSCWIHRAKQEFEMPEWQAWLKELGVQGEYEGIGHCVLGYTDGEYPAAKPREAGRVYYVK